MDKKSLLVISSIMATLILAIFFIIGLAVGIGANEKVIFTNDTMSAWVSALATVCIAMLTIFLAKETWNLRTLQQHQIEELRKEALRPNVELYLESNRASFQFMDVHIENSGNGPARNIFFSLRNISEADQESTGNKVIDQLNSLSMFSKGIVSLVAGKRRSSFVFSFIELSEELGEAAFGIKLEILISYSDYEGRMYQSTSILDFSEYKGIHELGGGDPAYQTYQELKKLREIFDGFKGNMPSKRLSVDVWSAEDRANYEKMLKDRMEAQRRE
jgi:hypothetical protein